MEPKETKVKSLYKALMLLDYFTVPPYECGVTEIAQKTGLPKSTVHNILSTFSQYGLLEYETASRRYKLGYRSLELSNSFNNANNLISIVRPQLESISEATGEHVYLGRLADTEVMYLDAVCPQSTIMGGSIVGTKAPLYCTGIGKAILAFSDSKTIDAIMQKDFETFTDNTITDKSVFRIELDKIRNCGYSVDDMEHEFGVKCVAVPIFGQNNNLVGAMSISGPSLRFPTGKIKQHAILLSQAAYNVKKFL